MSKPRQAGLTARQSEVMGLVAQGLRNAQIGERMGISEHTVRSMLRTVFDRLDVDTRAQAVAVWMATREAA